MVGTEEESEQDSEADDDGGDVDRPPRTWIVVLAVVATVFCCCMGIGVLFVPGYRRFRKELLDQWRYNEEKERSWEDSVSTGGDFNDDNDEAIPPLNE